MKRLLTFIAITLTGTQLLHPQEAAEEPAAGFLNIVNLVGLKTPTYVDLGGFALNGGVAMKPGDSSGVLAIKAARFPFTLSNVGAKPDKVTGDFVMEAGKTVAIICFDEVKEYRDGSEEVKLRYTVLVESDATGPRLSLVSLLREPLAGLGISGSSVTLTPRVAHQHQVTLEDEILIDHEGRTLTEFAIEKAVHYLGFLFENVETGEIEISLIENEKLEYQPPLETGDEEEE